MQVFGNLATNPTRRESRISGRGYFEFRICEAQRGVDPSPCWYTVRVMKDEDPLLDKGDFVKVTGKLKADFYIGRDGKPSGTLLIIAFEASKIAKPAALKEEPASGAPPAAKAKSEPEPELKLKPKAPAPDRVTTPAPQQPPELVRVTVEQEEADWTTLYS